MSLHTAREFFWYDTLTPDSSTTLQTTEKTLSNDDIDKLKTFLNTKTDCKTTDGDWSQCFINTKSDGTKEWIRSMTRTVTQYPRNGGASCPDLVVTQACPTESTNCKVGYNGKENEWSEWSNCFYDDNPSSQTFKQYIKIATRDVISPPTGLGEDCGALIKYDTCSAQDCTKEDLSEEKSPWSACYYDKTNNNYQQVRRRYNVTAPARYGGNCDYTNPTNSNYMLEYKNCAAVDCTYSDWQTTDCFLHTDGTYKKLKYRTIKTPPKNGGVCNEDLTQYIDCNNPINCEYNAWDAEGKDWSKCYRKDDGMWYHYRVRDVKTVDRYGGVACDVQQLSQEALCPDVDCQTTSDWKDYSSQCYAHADGTKWKLQYRDFTDAVNNGRACVESDYTREVQC